MAETEKPDLKEQVALLPLSPGVYQFVDRSGTIIYVGKAKSLRKRVSSYFVQSKEHSAKVRVLVRQIAAVRHIVVGSETDALLLENSLIKSLQPRYNILLKDDKTYPWIVVRREAFPRVQSTRTLLREDPERRQQYSQEILALENRIFEIRNAKGRLIDRINTIEQEWVLSNLDAGGAGGAPHRTSAAIPDSLKVRNLVCNPWFGEQLPAADYAALRRAQDMEMVAVDYVNRYFANYDTLKQLAETYAAVGTEAEAQELVDHIVMKFRMVKFARITSYQELFSGDPVWATLEVGGTGLDGRSMVTKNDYRFLHTLENMGPSPEPNMTVLYTSRLPEAFKKYAAHISIVSSSIQYENDDVMKPVWGDDYSICCCVSATQTGKEMQFFGARANLLKALLYAINGGMDEKLKTQVGPCYAPITTDELTWDIVKPAYLRMLDWLAGLYVNVLNLIHYMHDKYYYEAAEMALIDTHVKRSFATGIAGFSHCVDSISALKYAKVTAIRDESGMVYDYKTEGEFPKYGNDDDRADDIAKWLLKTFIDMVKKHHTYRNSEPSTSILTITSNVVYGKATGSTPDGRRAWTPLAPGANPSYGAEQNGLVASLNSTAKLPYHWALDGISNTQTINPDALGHAAGERVNNLVQVMDGYFDQGAHHLNVNVFGKEKLLDAMEHPEKEEYANFTIRVSGYAVKFIDLTREQQLDVIARTCHTRM